MESSVKQWSYRFSDKAKGIIFSVASIARQVWEAEHSLSISIFDSGVRRVSPHSMVALLERIGPSLCALRVRLVCIDSRWKEKFYEALLRVPEFCANLKAIYISVFPIIDTIPEWMRFDAFSALKRFSLSSCSGVRLGAETFLSIPPSIQIAEGLFFQENGQTWNAWYELKTFFRSHPRLQRVRFIRLPDDLCGANLYETIAQYCPQLKSLHLNNFRSVVGLERLEGMKEIIVKYEKGHRKFTRPPPWLTSDQLLTLCARNREIRVLQIADFFGGKISKEAWMALASLTKLRNVDLYSAQEVSIDVVDQLILNSGPTLQCMWVGVLAFPASILDRISERCPRLRSIKIGLAFSGELEAKVSAFVDGLTSRRRSRNKPLSIVIGVDCPNDEVQQRLQAFEQTILTRHPGIDFRLYLD